MLPWEKRVSSRWTVNRLSVTCSLDSVSSDRFCTPLTLILRTKVLGNMNINRRVITRYWGQVEPLLNRLVRLLKSSQFGSENLNYCDSSAQNDELFYMTRLGSTYLIFNKLKSELHCFFSKKKTNKSSKRAKLELVRYRRDNVFSWPGSARLCFDSLRYFDFWCVYFNEMTRNCNRLKTIKISASFLWNRVQHQVLRHFSFGVEGFYGTN